MVSALKAALHPLAVFAFAKDWNQRECAEHFGIDYPAYRQIVGGHVGVSYYRAEAWEAKSKGKKHAISAVAVMKWQKRNRKGA